MTINTGRWSGTKNSSGMVMTAGAEIRCIIITPGTETTRVVLYDNTEASGAEIFNGKFAANGDTKQFSLHGMQVENGGYLAISGSGATAAIYLS